MIEISERCVLSSNNIVVNIFTIIIIIIIVIIIIIIIKVVTGSYTVHLPDGRIQTVKYTADHYNGYVADVSVSIQYIMAGN